MTGVVAAACCARGALTASVATGGTIGEAGGNGAQALSGTSSVTVSGGVAPYTYSWTRTAGDTQVTASASTSQTTGWASTGTDVVRMATYKCTVSDSAGSSVDVEGFQITYTHGTPP